MVRIVVILIAITLLFHDSLAQRASSFSISSLDGNVVSVPSVLIQNQHYIFLKTLSSIQKNSIVKENENKLLLHGFDCVFTKGSFLVTIERQAEYSLSQLTLPIVEFQNQLLLPFPQVFSALKYCGSSTFSKISDNAFEEKSSSTTFSIVWMPRYLPLSSPRATTTIPEEEQRYNAKIDKKFKSIPPNKYKIPKDLKRRNVDDKQLNSLSTLEGYSIASLGLDLKNAPVGISSVTTKNTTAHTSLIFTFSDPYKGDVSASIEGRRVTLKFPDAVRKFTLKSLEKNARIEKTESSIQHGAQQIEFLYKSPDRSVTVQKISSTKIEIKILPKESKINDSQKQASNWNLDCIVLDAGHGGKDDGATGISGTLEKNIALSIVKKIELQLKKVLPKTKVVLTRSTDTFVELEKRGEIANAAGGKLFISVHCNSMPQKPHPANGFETYVLSPGKTDNAIEVADRENSSIKLQSQSKYASNDQLILATLAQNSFVKLSQSFANRIQSIIEKHTALKNRGVNQAGFIVLIGASMPSVLIETGFLSNFKDEKYLNSTKGQNKIASAICTAILSYNKAYKNLVPR